ncbi:MAG TPA: NIPSNAP family protein [Opitutaceae bacterium]|nr:NIPSNAP family protein [Opitutaceae bacterium]
MKLPRLGLGLLLCGLVACSVASAADTRVYELRTYTTAPGKRDALLARFRDHTTRLFEKHGMTNVGYWVPAESKDGGDDKLVYLLSYPSRDAAKESWKAFSADTDWQKVRKESEAAGKILAKPPESVFLTPTDYSKAMAASKKGAPARVVEMRTYTAPEGKLGALDARFRDHTLALFAKHGITNLGYFHPLDADKGAGNTLIYFIAHKDRAAADASWKAFREDADWQKALTASQKDGKLTTKVESVYLTPTDFSALK